MLLKKFQESHLSEYPIETLFDLAQLYFKQDYSIIKTWKREIKETSTIFSKKKNSQLTDITNKIIWFDHVKSWTLEEIHQITPHRNYDPNKKYLESEAGEFYSNKLQRNVFYESMLEKKFYKRLEKSHEVIYYVEQGITITYDRGKYTPDAIVFLDDGKGFVVEIKPLTEMANQSVQKKFKALLDFCEETGLGATLTDGRTDINHIFETIPNLAFEESILQSLKEFKKLTYGKVNELKNKYQVTTIHLLQCIIKNNLSYNSMPTFIWKTKKPIICDLLLSPENKMLLKGSTDIINNDKT
ncbi:RNA polymerase subunit sigma [Bacteroides thetaiotaomicron]|nr:RNA polymerase subunit sigma [Bacteroides thetaiotaomicron]